MSDLENNQEVAIHRENPLEDDQATGLKVVASKRDQQLEDLAKELEKQNIGQKVQELWLRANADRAEWLERQDKFLVEIDEFIDPIYEQPLDWSSNIHLPTILTVVKTFHARVYSALMGIDPPFTVKSRKAANSDRAMLVEELVRYTLKEWCNEHDGVEDVVDRWLWDWCMRGVGILKARWHTKFTRFKDVEIERIEDVILEVDPVTGEKVPRPLIREIEHEVTKTERTYAGPVIERIPVEDIIIIGGEGDPQKADYVMQQSWMTADELWSLVDQKIFRAEAVENTIKAGKDRRVGTDETGLIKQRQIEQAGMALVDKEHEINRYRVIETYIKVDLDGSGITSDVIAWIHGTSRQILRATYLRRVSPTGMLPYFKIDFHLRHGTEYGVGLVELLYSLGKEMDAIHNINVDVGILSSLPFGFYRPTASSLKDEGLPIEPGVLIPVDNPQSDVYFPNLGIRTSFGFQEQQALQVQVDRLSSMSDMNYGILGAQGMARTATGARALLGEASNNLNIYIQRMNRGWKKTLKYLFAMLQTKIDPGFQFRILGDDGNAYWRQVQSREELAGMYDFELEANSANSNKQVQIEQANMIVMMTGNPIDLQLGLVTPAERYEALAYQLKVNGIKDVSKYLRKPTEVTIRMSPIEVLNRTLAGIDFPLDPTQDLQGFLDLVQHFLGDETLMGQLTETQAASMIAKAQEADGLMQAIAAAQAQQMAIQQQQLNSGANVGMQPGSVNQTPPPGEGG